MSDKDHDSLAERISEDGIKRRTVLGMAATAIGGGYLYTQSENTHSENTPSGKDGNQDDSTQSPALNVDRFNLNVDTNDVAVPAAWTSEDSINDLQTTLALQFEANQPVDIALNKNDSEWETWKDTRRVSEERTVQPRELESGDNRFTADLGEANSQVEDRQKTIHKNTPQDFLLDIQSANNRDAPIFNTYSSHEQLSHDKKPVDLDELEEWHDNDYENLSELHPTMEMLVEGIGNQNVATEAKQNPTAILYRNHEEVDARYGFFDQEAALNANSIGEFLDEAHRLLFNIESEHDEGAISTEDEQYAASLQEAADQYLKGRNNQEDVESHFWAFDLPHAPRSTHGNGFVWDETNDELRVLETVHAPVTATSEDTQYHPLIEDSNYLDPEHDAYNWAWHPLRFDGTEPERGPLEFKDGKAYANSMFRGIATGFQDNDLEKFRDEAGVGVTTKYLVDVVDTLKNYNSNSFNFEQLKKQSKVFNKLWAEDDGNYILGGTVDNPVYAQVEDESKIEDIWSDQEGTLVDYVEELDQETYDQIMEEETGQASMSISSVKETLSGVTSL